MSADGSARTSSDPTARVSAGVSGGVAGKADPAADPMTGRLLDGRYRIGPRIARGGMASVYEATDIRLDRVCAVKVMHPGLGDDDDFAERFVREARAAARLSHPNVVNVFDQGDDASIGGGTVFLAMEYVPGHTLRDVIRKEAPMAPARALALIEPVLSALAAAHRAGLIHRDIKPENVLIGDEAHGGRVKVADFGLAKAVSADTQHTATGGVLIGTVSYLAPELVVDGRADARADVYAAGVVLYEMLTGRKPHEGESPIAVAYKHVHEDVPAPSASTPGIPPYVDALVARATARDKDLRPADASVLLHQVHRVSHALSTGVVDDEDLTADLMPRRGISGDTEADPFDDADLATILTPVEVPPEVQRRRDASAEETEAIRRPAPLPTPAPRPVTAPPSRRTRRSRRGPLLLVLALLLVAAAGAGAWWFGYGRYTATPSVLDLTRTAAVAKLDQAGLDATVGDKVFSETVQKGHVIGTDPAPGSQVLKHGTVTLTLSLGPERYDVPRLAGLSENKAQDRLRTHHLVFGHSVGRWSETVPRGTVIRSDPPAGTTERPQAVVDLVVSKGPQPIRIRDWTGQSADRATRVLTSQGLDVVREPDVFSDSVPEGHVVTQDPTTGPLHRGDEVHLTVSKGPDLVAVPSGLVGSRTDDAIAALERAGLKADVRHISNYLGLGFVYGTNHSAGDEVRRGSTVVLYVI